MKIYCTVSPVFEENCYIVVNDKNQALIVDPGAYTKKMIDMLMEDINAEPKSILLTHGHLDHIWDAGKFNIPTYIPKPDMYRLDDPYQHFGEEIARNFRILANEEFVPIKNIQPLPDETYTTAFEIIDGFFLRGIPTPGHTEGSSIFLFSCEIEDYTARGIKNEHNLYAFGGDVIFASSVGRTDLPGGDRTQMLQSLRTICNIVDPRTIFLTGHGIPTALWYEKENNSHIKYAMKMG
ncbi:MBL fold metallo-hydrolase [Actinomyces sp. zg-332]|uniref:MBL fold metallo-hydrolase n=1 Tax=Actinomyces sp. zg-332 TaxID=2708340 RepID=UPI00141DB518|nr:MBL fold metallo-hydrolase [Actinomyces sp. zg-332]QPK93654.1 MBL fold metallo-hydrolase [Actinomyces sp. zg-332]